MISTADLIELHQIVNGTHGNPHNILGMHEIEVDGNEALVVRAFNPHAKSMSVYDPKLPKKKIEMQKIHVDGFFETVITDRTKWFRYMFNIEGHENNTWTTYDPYSFMPVISDLDLHLFGEGTHYKIYDKLGAYEMVCDGIEGVLFAVWAPNAKRISVIGDFNSWDGRRNPMRVLEGSGVWEIFIPGVKQMDKYKFEIKSVTGAFFHKSDPYEKFGELRPETASIVYNIDNYEWNDAKWLKDRDDSDVLNRPMNIYEVHLGSWKRVPEEYNRFLTYRELAEELVDYVKDMGYTHIELMPVEEHPFDGSWGYQVTGYFAPTSRYGTPEDFMYFVDKCHQNNIGIILDWVPAHFPKDSHGLAKFDGTALYEHQDPRQGEHPDWGTLIFNYGRKEVKNFLIANALFWIEKYHLDGLRVDAVASMLYLDYGKQDGQWVPNIYGGRENLEAVEFMKHMNSIITGKHPNILMIAEESTAWPGVSKPTKHDGLGFKLKWNMGWMNDFLLYISKDPVYRKYHHGDLTFSMIYAYTENFILVLSHDEVVHGKCSMINKMPGDLWQKFANLRTAYGFMYGHPGKKLIFMGGEFAQFEEWSEDKSLDWFLLEYDHHKQMLQYMKDLNHFYLNEPALWADDFRQSGFEWLDCNDWEASMLSFVRKGYAKEDNLIYVCNFTPAPRMGYRLGLPFEGSFKEVFNSDNEKYGGSNVINTQICHSEKIASFGRENSIVVDVPPLGVTVLKLV